MKKILFILAVSCCSAVYAQNLNFTDSKFKALILSSDVANEIAKDINGNFIAIDANNDGEIQVSEALQVKILTIKQDENLMYIDPNGNPFDAANINLTYYNNHLPEGISDALLFPNVEELYVSTAKSFNISYINNDKIRIVKGSPRYFNVALQNQYTASPINLSFDNCSNVTNINDVIAYQTTVGNWPAPENSLKIKNCSQINSNATIEFAELKELYIENSNISTLQFNSCKLLSKIDVPGLNSLIKITISELPSISIGIQNQFIELNAANCNNLEEIVADTDHYYSVGAYFSTINVNGCSSLKKIKGINAPTINFSNSGLINLEELDCSFYNRYVYNTNSGVFYGTVSMVNLSGLPSLKVFKAFNQPITNDINFSVTPNLQSIDITNSCGYMNTVNTSNLLHLHTLKADRVYNNSNYGNIDLQNIIAQNCTALINLEMKGNYHLKNINLQNSTSLQQLILNDYNFNEVNTLNPTGCSGLKEIVVSDTAISQLNITNCSDLEKLSLSSNNLLSQVNLLNNPNINEAYVTQSPLITSLNFSGTPFLQKIRVPNMINLTSLIIRNNSLEQFFDFNNHHTNLTVCVDNNQLVSLQNTYPDINFTTSCDITLNTDLTKLKEKIKIYPNPIKDFVFVKAENNIKNIKIYDIQGRIIHNQDYNDVTVKIDLSSKPIGNYLIKIKTENQELTEKVMRH